MLHLPSFRRSPTKRPLDEVAHSRRHDLNLLDSALLSIRLGAPSWRDRRSGRRVRATSIRSDLSPRNCVPRHSRTRCWVMHRLTGLMLPLYIYLTLIGRCITVLAARRPRSFLDQLRHGIILMVCVARCLANTELFSITFGWKDNSNLSSNRSRHSGRALAKSCCPSKVWLVCRPGSELN
jgi:hypothetical protein